MFHFDTIASDIICYFESGVNSFQRFKYLLTTTKNRNPNASGQLIIVIIEYAMLIKDPILNSLPFHKIFHYFDTILEVLVDLFLSESYITGIVGVSG